MIEDSSWPKKLVVLLLFFGAAVALLAIAWRSMNAGTLTCFAVLVAWVINQERVHFHLGNALIVAEKRIWALEECAGIRRAYLDEVRAANVDARLFGDSVASRLRWPRTEDMARWRRLHWAGWSARMDRIASSTLDMSDEDTSEQRLDGLDEEAENLKEQRPYFPPPESSEGADEYWSDESRWTLDDQS